MKPGHIELREWMDRRWPLSSRKQTEVAEYLDVDESTVCKMLKGRRDPGLANAIKIERLTGIPVEAWVSSELDHIEATCVGMRKSTR